MKTKELKLANTIVKKILDLIISESYSCGLGQRELADLAIVCVADAAGRTVATAEHFRKEITLGRFTHVFQTSYREMLNELRKLDVQREA